MATPEYSEKPRLKQGALAALAAAAAGPAESVPGENGKLCSALQCFGFDLSLDDLQSVIFLLLQSSESHSHFKINSFLKHWFPVLETNTMSNLHALLVIMCLYM